MKKELILVGCTLVSALSYANNSPVSVRTYVSNGVDGLAVQSNEDSITIYDTKVNRGHCAVQPYDRSSTLVFGEEKKYFLTGCNVTTVKEIQVSTDRGTVTFTNR